MSGSKSFEQFQINISDEWKSFSREYKINPTEVLKQLKTSYNIDLDEILEKIRVEYGFNVLGLLFSFEIGCHIGAKTPFSKKQINGLNAYFGMIDSVDEKKLKTPLALECEKNNYESAMVLAFIGADVENGGHNEETPLSYACKYNFDKDLYAVSTELKKHIKYLRKS